MIPIPPLATVVANPVTAGTLLGIVGWPVVLAAAVVVLGQVAVIVRLALGSRRSSRRAARPRLVVGFVPRGETRTPAQPA